MLFCMKGGGNYFLMFILCSILVNADVVINEIMYDPAGTDTDHEWIELYNNGSEVVNLTNWKFFEAGSDHGLTLGQGDMLILSGEYVVIVQNNETFLSDYTGYAGNVIDSSFSLSNTGEYIALKNSSLDIVDEVYYLNSWGGENNISLELLNPIFDNNISLSWNSSLVAGGTPGEQNSIFEDIDDTAPAVNLIYPENGSYLNFNNLNFSFSVIDNSEILNCSLYLNSTLNQTNETVLNSTLTYFNAFHLDEGIYEWNVTCMDFSSNINSSSRLLNIDMSLPSLSNLSEAINIDFIIINFTTNEGSNTTIYYGADLNLTENASESDFLFNHSMKIENLASGTFYYYNISFCDVANNCNLSKTYNFTTSTVTVLSGDGGSSSGGSGGGGGLFTNIPITDLSDTQITLYSWSTVYFILDNEQHNIRIKTIENDILTLTISSDPFDVVLEVNETKDIDVNQNGMNDLRITLVSIEGFKAVLHFEEIEEISEELNNDVEAENATEDSNLITGAAVYDVEADPLVGGIILVVIVAFGLVLYFVFKK